MKSSNRAPVGFVADELSLERSLSVADIGANPLSPPPYQALLDNTKCTVIGFEPQAEAFQALQHTKGSHEQYFPYAIGGGGDVILRIYRNSGFTSAFPICARTIEFLRRWQRGTQLRAEHPIKTKRLDDVEGLPPIDLLKIDIQGGELAVFQNGRAALAGAVCIITEVNFLQLYEEGAPSFGEIHAELTSQGFILHKFMFTKAVQLPGSQDHVPAIAKARNQLVDGDAVYIRDMREPAGLSTWQLKALAILADTTFGSPDLAVRCLDELVARKAVEPGLPGRYTSFFLEQPSG